MLKKPVYRPGQERARRKARENSLSVSDVRATQFARCNVGCKGEVKAVVDRGGVGGGVEPRGEKKDRI